MSSGWYFTISIRRKPDYFFIVLLLVGLVLKSWYENYGATEQGDIGRGKDDNTNCQFEVVNKQIGVTLLFMTWIIRVLYLSLGRWHNFLTDGLWGYIYPEYSALVLVRFGYHILILFILYTLCHVLPVKLGLYWLSKHLILKESGEAYFSLKWYYPIAI